MNRLDAKFSQIRESGEVGIIVYLTVGYPELQATIPLVQAVVEGGADVIELGVPFSDPLADGATLQKASAVALAQGITLSRCLEVGRQLRGITSLPLVLMSYFNPILSYGVKALARDAATAGLDGLIVVDLPPEEAEELRQACLGLGLDLIFLVSPTSTEERIRRVAEAASGFIYCVSVAGVTGARSELASTLPQFLARVRQKTFLPLAVGFGISTAQHVKAMKGIAEAAVVGSALAEVIGEGAPSAAPERARRFIAQLKG